jgi:hypothetical protein
VDFGQAGKRTVRISDRQGIGGNRSATLSVEHPAELLEDFQRDVLDLILETVEGGFEIPRSGRTG